MQTHTIVEGDTLTGLAEQYGVTVEAIREANNITPDVDYLKVGSALSIPEPVKLDGEPWTPARKQENFGGAVTHNFLP